MLNRETNCKMEDFGFDFSSVLENQLNHSPPGQFGSKTYEPLNKPISSAVSVKIGTPSIEEMAEELRDATDITLNSLCLEEEDNDGISVAELLANRQATPTSNRIVPQRANARNTDDELSVEKILDQVLDQAQLAVCRGIIWGASLDDRIWRPLQTDAQISNFLHGLGIRRYGNTVRWFSNRVSGDYSFNVPGFFENANLWGKVSFADGLWDTRTDSFTERTLEDRVIAVLRWNYQDVTYPPNYERLKEAMQSLAGTEETYLRLQELCGVALHAEPSGRILYFQHHNPRIASIFTKLLGKVWSDDAVSFLGMRDHERSFRTAQVLEHPIVISGKEGESSLRDISTILALVDGDGINTDRKNQDPFDFISRCSMTCAGRNLPSLQKGSMETLRYYLVRVNMTGDLPDNISIRELLSYTKAFTVWSLEGLHRFIANNGRFTVDESSDIPREEASILSFVEEAITENPNGKIPASVLHEAYSNFCMENNMSQLPKPRLVSYLRDTFHIESRTIRVPWFNEGKPAFGYVGIRFIDEYFQHHMMPDDEDSADEHLQPVQPDEDDQPFWDDDQSSWDDGWKPDFVSYGAIDY